MSKLKDKDYLGRWCYEDLNSEKTITVDIVKVDSMNDVCIDDANKRWNMTDFKPNSKSGILFKENIDNISPIPDLTGFNGLVHKNKVKKENNAFSDIETPKNSPEFFEIEALGELIEKQKKQIDELEHKLLEKAFFDLEYTKNNKSDMVINAISASSTNDEFSSIPITFNLNLNFDFKKIIKLCEMFQLDLNEIMLIIISNISKDELKNDIIKGLVDYTQLPKMD